MRIKDFLTIFIKRGWLILIFAAATAFGAIVVSKLQEPAWRVSVRMAVTPARADLGLSETINRLLRNYGEQLTTRRMAQIAIDRLRLQDKDPSMTADKLRKELRVSAQLSNYTLQLDVEDRDPNRARDVALILSTVFVEEQRQKMADIDPRDRLQTSVLDQPTWPRQIRPKTKTNALGGGILGLLVGAMVVVAWELLDDSLKTAEQTEQVVGLPVLAAIPAASSKLRRSPESFRQQAASRHGA
jgi:capsular polysaccharide biosynthesis protein